MRNAPQSQLSQSFFAAIFAILTAVSCGGHQSAAHREATSAERERVAACQDARQRLFDAFGILGALASQGNCQGAERAFDSVQRFATEAAAVCGDDGPRIERAALEGAKKAITRCIDSQTAPAAR